MKTTPIQSLIAATLAAAFASFAPAVSFPAGMLLNFRLAQPVFL